MKPTKTDPLPPHDDAAEDGILSCCIQKPSLIAERCRHLTAEVFWDIGKGILWQTMRDLDSRRVIVDAAALAIALNKAGQLDRIGHDYLSRLPDLAPSPENIGYYLEIALDKYALRKTRDVLAGIPGRIASHTGSAEALLKDIQADLEQVQALKAEETRPAFRCWSIDELNAYEPDPRHQLVGDHEIKTGYEGLAMIAGPGSSGKSLCAMTLALAGAIGSGTWQGRRVHRQFKTLVLQAENGPTRLKEELTAMQRQHPDLDLNDWIRISSPPDGGLPFHRGDFRAWVRSLVKTFQPDLVELDPWSQVAADDSAKDVMDKLGEIRSCLNVGDTCPGTLIVCHTKKPRPEDVRRGRALTNLVHGSIALPNTCRCVYLLLPWSDELDDERIYWACTKLNDGKMYPATVWKRRFGTFFEHDAGTDPRAWGMEERTEEARRTIEPEDIEAAFGSETILKKSALARRLEEKTGAGYSTAMRAITPGKFGYLAHLVDVTDDGCVRYKRNGE